MVWQLILDCFCIGPNLPWSGYQMTIMILCL